MPTPEQIDAAIKAIAPEYDGMSGNCGRFAAILNRVLGGAGEYLLVESGHYEFSDHVYLCYEGNYYDSTGLCSRLEIEDLYPSEMQEGNGTEDEDDEDDGEYLVEDTYVLEDFIDPSEDGAMIRNAVDTANIMAAQWSDEDLESDFATALASQGVEMPCNVAASLRT